MKEKILIIAKELENDKIIPEVARIKLLHLFGIISEDQLNCKHENEFIRQWDNYWYCTKCTYSEVGQKEL